MTARNLKRSFSGFFAAIVIGVLLSGSVCALALAWNAWMWPVARMKGHYETKSVIAQAYQGFVGGAMLGGIGGFIAGAIIAARRHEAPYP